MRNVYSLLNYGSNFTGNGDVPPYMQILSVSHVALLLQLTQLLIARVYR